MLTQADGKEIFINQLGKGNFLSPFIKFSVPGAGSAAFGSNDTFIENGVEQTASVTGGLVRVENIRPVPEPLTILGAGTAIGFGTAFKKKLGKNKKNK